MPDSAGEVTGDPTIALNTPELNFTGHPAVSVPLGLDDAGVPFGLQVVAPRFADGLALGLAEALEARAPLADGRSGLRALLAAVAPAFGDVAPQRSVVTSPPCMFGRSVTPGRRPNAAPATSGPARSSCGGCPAWPAPARARRAGARWCGPRRGRSRSPGPVTLWTSSTSAIVRSRSITGPLLALGDLEGGEGEHRVAERRRGRRTGPKPLTMPRGPQAVEPSLHGAPGDPEPAGQLEHAGPGDVGSFADEAAVEVVHAGHSDRCDARTAGRVHSVELHRLTSTASSRSHAEHGCRLRRAPGPDASRRPPPRAGTASSSGSATPAPPPAS